MWKYYYIQYMHILSIFTLLAKFYLKKNCSDVSVNIKTSITCSSCGRYFKTVYEDTLLSYHPLYCTIYTNLRALKPGDWGNRRRQYGAITELWVNGQKLIYLCPYSKDWRNTSPASLNHGIGCSAEKERIHLQFQMQNIYTVNFSAVSFLAIGKRRYFQFY